MFTVPYSSDESEPGVKLKKKSDSYSQRDQSRRRTRKGPARSRDRAEIPVESYVRWETQHNHQGTRNLGSRRPLEGVQEADDDSRSTANSQDEDAAHTRGRLFASVAHWAVTWSSWLWQSFSPLQLLQGDSLSPSLDDSDVSFQEPLGPAMSTTSSSYDPAGLAGTTQGISFFERVYRAICSVLHGINRFVESVTPLAQAGALVSFLLQLVILSYLGVSSYYYSLNESSIWCDFGLTAPFLSFCTTTPTMDSPAVDIFVDIHIMTERWISTVEATDQAATMSLALSNASIQADAFRKALTQSGLISRDILDQAIADFVDKSEANQHAWINFSSTRLGAFDGLWIKLFTLAQRLKVIEVVNANLWSPTIWVVNTIQLLFPQIPHPSIMLILDASVRYLSILGDEIETRLLPQGQQLLRNFTLIQEDLHRIEKIFQKDVELANNKNSHARLKKKTWGFWMSDYKEDVDWLIEQKQSLKLYDPFRQDCITRLDEVLDIYIEIDDEIKDLIKRLQAPEAMKGFDQAHLEREMQNIEITLFRLHHVSLEEPGKRGVVYAQTTCEAYPETSLNSQEALTSSEASPDASQNGEEGLTSSEAYPKASQNGEEDLTTCAAYPEANQTGDFAHGSDNVRSLP